jgi:hypothetical protein
MRRINLDEGDVSRFLPPAFLAPDIVEAILAGRQPLELTSEMLKRFLSLPAFFQERFGVPTAIDNDGTFEQLSGAASVVERYRVAGGSACDSVLTRAGSGDPAAIVGATALVSEFERSDGKQDADAR